MYISSKSEHGMHFGIQHFAGLVYYDCEGTIHYLKTLKSKLLLVWKMFILSGFLEKNRDTLSIDIMELVRKSSNKFLKLIFEKETNINSVKNSNKANKIIITPKSSLRVWHSYRTDWQYWLNIDNSFSINSLSCVTQQVNDSRRQVSTLSGQFRQSLDSLMKALSLCQPFFIRCFKPNDKKMSMVSIHMP